MSWSDKDVKGTCPLHFEHWSMRKLFSKWVLYLITIGQKHQRFDDSESCVKLFWLHGMDFSLIKTWTHHYTLELKSFYKNVMDILEKRWKEMKLISKVEFCETVVVSLVFLRIFQPMCYLRRWWKERKVSVELLL